MDKKVATKVKETFALSPYPSKETDDVTVTMSSPKKEGDEYPFSTSSPL
jgi:hypothetical protein